VPRHPPHLPERSHRTELAQPHGALHRAAGAGDQHAGTFNPEAPGDPDGGGEIVGGPVVGPDGTIYGGRGAMTGICP
jgi:hypothetical protein